MRTVADATKCRALPNLQLSHTLAPMCCISCNTLFCIHTKSTLYEALFSGNLFALIACVMSEMLGNRFFMIRDYAAAAREFEAALAGDPHNKPVRKKLIICYAQLSRVSEALDAFRALIEEDIEFIINTDPDADECPCPELIFEEENNWQSPPVGKLPMLGMLWLYCNPEKSLQYFEQASAAAAHDAALCSIVTRLREYLSHAGTILTSQAQPNIIKPSTTNEG
ncbi:MAG: tetratricopeptide repeat protein [Ignavibacteriae bacterium]|nr:tetratricopeptide repeat protein [Ignavibacteriota bacterium]